MQDPSTYLNQFPDHEILKCPRCDSSNTKFCYYNNYNLSQPRHYCKNCKRYWTKGGTLRNIPIGGASRKIAKRSSSSSSSNPKRPSPPDSITDKIQQPQQQQQQQALVGSSSPTASYSIDGRMGFEQMGELGVGDPKVENGERFRGVGSGEMNCWSGTSNDWPDLAIFTPRGSSFQ